jgi:hypothetical protein
VASKLDREVRAWRAAQKMGPHWKRALIKEIHEDDVRRAREARDREEAQARADRKAGLEQARDICAAERAEVTRGCAARRDTIRGKALERIAKAEAEAAERIRLDRAEKRRQRGARKAAPSGKRGVRLSESDDAVANEVEHWEPRLLSVWERLKHSPEFRPGSAHERFERFEHYVHDNGGPEAFIPQELPADSTLSEDFAAYWRSMGEAV